MSISPIPEKLPESAETKSEKTAAPQKWERRSVKKQKKGDSRIAQARERQLIPERMVKAENALPHKLSAETKDSTKQLIFAKALKKEDSFYLSMLYSDAVEDLAKNRFEDFKTRRYNVKELFEMRAEERPAAEKELMELQKKIDADLANHLIEYVQKLQQKRQNDAK